MKEWTNIQGGDETVEQRTSRGLSQILASAILVLELEFDLEKKLIFKNFKGQGTICLQYKCQSPQVKPAGTSMR